MSKKESTPKKRMTKIGILSFGILSVALIPVFFVFATHGEGVSTDEEQSDSSIAINGINEESPRSYTCPDNPLENPVTLSGDGLGSAPPGNIDQYHVQIDWGDGTVENEVSATFLPPVGQDFFSFVYNAGPHSYVTEGNKIITARLYHTQPPGEDNQYLADSVATVTVCTEGEDEPPALGSIHGTKWEDGNGNGVRDVGEDGLSGWIIEITDGDEFNDSTVTDQDGNYWFMNLDLGTYTVTEVTQEGWTQTTTNPDPIVLGEGDIVENVDFGNFELFLISGKKFNDLNGNGIRTNGTTDPNLSGWTIVLDLVGFLTPPSCESGTSESASVNGEYCEVLTDSFGNYEFINVQPGQHIVSEVQQITWTQTAPTAASGLGGQDDGTYVVDAESGVNRTNRNFGNQEKELEPEDGVIIIEKQTDPDGALTEFIFTGDVSGTLQDGNTAIAVVAPGTYTSTEAAIAGWNLTNITCDDNNSSGSTSTGVATFNVEEGETVTCVFTNTEDIPDEEEENGGGGGGGTTVPQSTWSNPGIIAVNDVAPVGEVLGETTTCGIYLTSYIEFGANNDPQEVQKLQMFLNDFQGESLPITGFYGPLTQEAVNRFQMAYWEDVLAPWVPYGLETPTTPTGYVYKTTKRKINLLYCDSLTIPLPNLP